MKTFKEAVRTQDFALSAELSLAPETDSTALLEQATQLCPLVDAIQLTDNPNARPHISALAGASLLIQNGIDAVPHLNCRDRNRIALKSDLLGLGALGVTSVLLMRGDKLPESVQNKAKPVFDYSAKEFIAEATALKKDKSITSQTEFFVGGVATVFNPKADWQAGEITSKADAGAQFIQTQLCFDVNVLRRYVACLVAAKLLQRIYIIVGLAPLPSADTARWIRKNVRGSIMPDTVVRRLEHAKDAEQEGVSICAEILQELAEIPGVSGANLMVPGAVETIPAAINASGLRSGDR